MSEVSALPHQGHRPGQDAVVDRGADRGEGGIEGGIQFGHHSILSVGAVGCPDAKLPGDK
ncbi:Uncharacterised protein [Mycobacteroides abscessus]|nr:Uncharacterised protein [Mycobacteroides abscessus]